MYRLVQYKFYLLLETLESAGLHDDHQELQRLQVEWVIKSLNEIVHVNVAGAGVGIGLVFSSLMSATSRNPALRPLFLGSTNHYIAGTPIYR